MPMTRVSVLVSAARLVLMSALSEGVQPGQDVWFGFVGARGCL